MAQPGNLRHFGRASMPCLEILVKRRAISRASNGWTRHGHRSRWRVADLRREAVGRRKSCRWKAAWLGASSAEWSGAKALLNIHRLGVALISSQPSCSPTVTSRGRFPVWLPDSPNRLALPSASFRTECYVGQSLRRQCAFRRPLPPLSTGQ
jgi:hypothetical protein